LVPRLFSADPIESLRVPSAKQREVAA
jgi:hypothetical protein